MTIRLNNFNKDYGKYNLYIGKENVAKAAEEEVSKEVSGKNPFKGLENETDLLTKTPQSVYGVQLEKHSKAEKEIADETNEILASLGYSYKVNPTQVASVSKSVNTVILPGLKSVDDEAVASRIADPNGPFADLFAV